MSTISIFTFYNTKITYAHSVMGYVGRQHSYIKMPRSLYQLHWCKKLHLWCFHFVKIYVSIVWCLSLYKHNYMSFLSHWRSNNVYPSEQDIRNNIKLIQILEIRVDVGKPPPRTYLTADKDATWKREYVHSDNLCNMPNHGLEGPRGW